MKHQTRRDFLTVGGGGAFAALALRSVGGCGPDDGTSTTSTGDPPAPSAEWTLDVMFAEISFNTITQGPIKAKLRTYGGKIPGPRIDTYPGDQLKVWVKNHLTDEAEKDAADHHVHMMLPERLQHIVPHMFNATNLHVHGVETVPHLFEPVGTSEPTSRNSWKRVSALISRSSFRCVMKKFSVFFSRSGLRLSMLCVEYTIPTFSFAPTFASRL